MREGLWAIDISGDSLSLDQVAAVARRNAPARLGNEPAIRERICASRRLLEDKIAAGEVIYGVNTGFGGNVRYLIPPHELSRHQENMFQFLGAGCGAPLPEDCVRAAILLRANALAKGFSGVRLTIVETLLMLLNHSVTPIVPRYGSVGASGDLIPAAYIARTLLGQGEVIYHRARWAAAEALADSRIEPLRLQAKEALALVNGTTVMTGIGALVIHDGVELAKLTLACATLALEALGGSDDPFRAAIHRVKNHPGQIAAAAYCRELLAGSANLRNLDGLRAQLSASRPSDGAAVRAEEAIQTPYSLRCVPQGLGPILDALSEHRKTIEREANSVNDNPLIDPVDKQIYHTGNFYGGHVARALDSWKIDLATMGNWLHALMAMLVDDRFSNGLPPNLSPKPGVSTGFKGMQLCLTSLVCAMRQMANPSMIHTLPTEQYNQDMVSLGTLAALTAADMTALLRDAVAIMLIGLRQAIALRDGAAARLGGGNAALYHQLAEQVPFLDEDRALDGDIGNIEPDSRTESSASVLGGLAMNIFNALAYGQENFPNKEALLFDGRTIAYGELHAEACRISALLVEVAQVERGDRVALFLPNGPSFVAAYYAAMHRGAIAVSLNVMLKHDEVKFILEDCEAKVLVTSAALLDQVPQSAALPALKKILCIDKSTRADAFALDQFSALECAPTESAEMGHGDGAAILYTSGTTGKPKGALLSHGNIISNLRAVRHHTQMGSDDRLICYLPLFHCFGQNFIMNAGLDAGASLIIHERFQPEEILASLKINRVTMFFGVPPVYQKLLTMAETEAAFRHVRYCFTAAAPMPMRVAQQWQQRLGQIVYEGYGLTETSPFASYNHDSLYLEGSVGTPIENVEMKIADARGNALAPGEIGEIAIKGPNVMLGYFRRQKDTEAAIRDGWFYTGDIGKQDQDGYFYLVDRAKDMINVAGYKVWPREVEDALMQHPRIADAAVVGTTDAESGEAVKAFIVLKPGAPVAESEMIEFAGARMAAYKVPRTVEIIDALPRNPAGKVLKRQLREHRSQFNHSTVQPFNIDLAHPDERLTP